MISRRIFNAQLLQGITALGAGSALAQGLSKYVLGQSAPTTGPAAQLGLQFNRGARLVFDNVNARGGVNGKKIELVLRDDGYDPSRTAKNTQDFIDEGVFALFGYIGTPTSLAALPLVTKAKIPFLTPFTGAMSLREPLDPNVVHLRASYNDETETIVKHSTSIGVQRIAVFYQNDAYGQAGLAGVKAALQSRGKDIVAIATVERNSENVEAAIKVIVATKPQAIVQITAYKSSAAFVRQARAAGYGGFFYNVSFVGTQALAQELGDAANGVMVSQVVPSPYSISVPVSADYLRRVKDNITDAQPNHTSFEGYLAARLVVEGLKSIGSNDSMSSARAKFLSGIKSIKGLDWGGFPLDFTKQRASASGYVDITMLKSGSGAILR